MLQRSFSKALGPSFILVNTFGNVASLLEERDEIIKRKTRQNNVRRHVRVA